MCTHVYIYIDTCAHGIIYICTYEKQKYSFLEFLARATSKGSVSPRRIRHVESCRWKILARIRCYGTICGQKIHTESQHKLGFVQGDVLFPQWETTTLGI